MARIRKEDHPTILHMVDTEGRTMASVAAEFGCTPANISALVRKLRQQAAAATPAAETQPAFALDATPPAAEPTMDSAESPASPAQATNVLTFDRASAPPPEPPVRATPPASVGARLAKPGFGLVMRSEDGDESMTPFRSLDDLLSAIKPILRASARNPEPVWFSLQPVDLATIEIDAA